MEYNKNIYATRIEVIFFFLARYSASGGSILNSLLAASNTPQICCAPGPITLINKLSCAYKILDMVTHFFFYLFSSKVVKGSYVSFSQYIWANTTNLTSICTYFLCPQLLSFLNSWTSKLWMEKLLCLDTCWRLGKSKEWGALLIIIKMNRLWEAWMGLVCIRVLLKKKKEKLDLYVGIDVDATVIH